MTTHRFRWADIVQPRSILALTIVLGILSLLAGQGTLAYFTSTATSTGNVFSTGTVTLRLTDPNETSLAAVTASFGSASFRPGDTVAGYTTVLNTGTLPFDYGLNYTATNTSGTLWVAGATNPTLEVYTAVLPATAPRPTRRAPRPASPRSRQQPAFPCLPTPCYSTRLAAPSARWRPAPTRSSASSSCGPTAPPVPRTPRWVQAGTSTSRSTRGDLRPRRAGWRMEPRHELPPANLRVAIGTSMRSYRLFLSVVALLGALTGMVDSGTYASFRSTASSSTNVFAAGTVDIASSPSTALLAIADMVPGETVTAPLTVNNSGSLQLRYAVSSTVTNADGKAIGAQLTLTIKTGVTTCTNAGFGSSGTVRYGSAALGAIGSSINLIGTPSSFPNGGRTINASAGETLCFQVGLPSNTGGSFQGGATTATFAFSAQQI